jgi:hypothetical protein
MDVYIQSNQNHVFFVWHYYTCLGSEDLYSFNQIVAYQILKVKIVWYGDYNLPTRATLDL